MSKKIYQFNTNGVLLKAYKSVADAARSVGVSKETLSMVCSGKRNTAAGYLWSFNNSINISSEKNDCAWVDIKGFEGEYQMSDRLEVKRLPFKVVQKDANGNAYARTFTGGIIKHGIDCEGYYYVSLNGNKYRLHWLYYNTFIGDSTGYIIDHINRNKLDNRPSNLRLVDAKTSTYNRTLAYKPDIQYRPLKSKKKPYYLRFSKDGKRVNIGNFVTYEEAENKYRELYNKRQNEIDANN